MIGSIRTLLGVALSLTAAYALPNLDNAIVILRPPIIVGLVLAGAVWATQADLHPPRPSTEHGGDDSSLTLQLAVFVSLLLPVVEWRRNGAVPQSATSVWMLAGCTAVIIGIALRWMSSARACPALLRKYPRVDRLRKLSRTLDWTGLVAIAAGHALVFRGTWSAFAGPLLLCLARVLQPTYTQQTTDESIRSKPRGAEYPPPNGLSDSLTSSID